MLDQFAILRRVCGGPQAGIDGTGCPKTVAGTTGRQCYRPCLRARLNLQKVFRPDNRRGAITVMNDGRTTRGVVAIAIDIDAVRVNGGLRLGSSSQRDQQQGEKQSQAAHEAAPESAWRITADFFLMGLGKYPIHIRCGCAFPRG